MVSIFTEAGQQYGFGHLMRCLAIAQGFRDHLIRVQFFIRGEGDFSKILADFPFENIDWLDSGYIEKKINNNDIAIIDSYYISQMKCEYFSNNYKRVLFFDDTLRIHYSKGFVLNGVIGARKLDYPNDNEIYYLLGTDFQPLRKEFWDVRNYILRDKINHILITFGGSDVTNETPGYIKKALNNFPEAIISVIIGNGFKNVNLILNHKDERVRIYHTPNEIEMINLMVDCDLAISSAGQTISELARVGTPTIGIQVVDNQGISIKNWQESGFLLTEDFLDTDISFDVRKRCSEIGRDIIDGQGVKRIVKKLIC